MISSKIKSKNSSSFLNVTEFYLDNMTKVINEERLVKSITEINPHVVVLAICFSKTLQLKYLLEKSAIFSKLRMQRDLNLISKGKILTLNPIQSDLLIKLAEDENNQTTVVISGPEGSGKSLLAIEATKMKMYSLFKQHSGQVKIRVVLCAAYQGDNRVPVLFQFLKEELKVLEENCLIETKPLGDLSVSNVKDLQLQIQKELSIEPPVYTKTEDIFTSLLPPSFVKLPTKSSPIAPNQQMSYPNFQDLEMADKSKSRIPEQITRIEAKKDSDANKDYEGITVSYETETEVKRKKIATIVLIDEVMPSFDLHQWKHFQSDPEVDYVVAIRHTFSQSAFPKIQPLEGVKRLEDSNTLICVLDKRLRCSNEITDLVFYLMIHSKNNSTLKSFEHSPDSFKGDVPLWIDVESVEDFIYFAKETYHSVDPKSVMVIYDPNDDQFALQPLLKYCLDKKWQCHPYSSIIGSEASRVFIYNLKEFHFESFTRATNELIIITIRSRGESQVSRIGCGVKNRDEKSRNYDNTENRYVETTLIHA